MSAAGGAWRRARDGAAAALLFGAAAWLIAGPAAALLVRAIGDATSVEEIWKPFTAGFGHRFANTLLIAGSTAALALLLGVALAAALAGDRRLPGRRVFYLFAFLPFWIPTYVVSIAAIEALGRNGAVARALVRLGLMRDFPSFIYSPVGVILVLTFSLLPFAILPVAMALRAQDGELLDSARLEGEARAIWWRLRLPMAAPAILTAGLLVFFFAAVEFAAPEQLQVPTGVVEVFVQFQASQSALGAVGAALPVIALCGALAWVLARRMGLGEGVALASFLHDYEKSSASLGRSKINWPGFVLCVAVLALPLGALLGLLAARAGGWSAYRDAFATSGQELLVSVVWSAAAAVVALALAVLIGARAYAWPRRRTRALIVAMAAALGVPGVLSGFGIVVLYNQPEWPALRWLYSSPAILLIAHLARALPVAALIAVPLMRGLDRSLWDAARLDGAERGWTGWRLLWAPHCGRVLPVAAGLLFVFNLLDLGAPLMVQPPGATPFIVRIFSLIHFGFDQYVAALCVILAGLCAGAAGGMWIVFNMSTILDRNRRN